MGEQGEDTTAPVIEQREYDLGQEIRGGVPRGDLRTAVEVGREALEPEVLLQRDRSPPLVDRVGIGGRKQTAPLVLITSLRAQALMNWLQQGVLHGSTYPFDKCVVHHVVRWVR